MCAGSTYGAGAVTLACVDGIHDMGGVRGLGLGRVEVEPDEPVFHERWEARIFGLSVLWAFPNLDASRHVMERIPALRYLSLPYYGRWLHCLEAQLLADGLLAPGELEARLAGDPGPALPMERPSSAARTETARRERTRDPLFRPGQHVRTRNLHPFGHTRLPGYARTRRGVVAIVHPAAWIFPDTHAQGRGENPDCVYAVCFPATELWGEDAEPNASVHVDLFESYLLPDPVERTAAQGAAHE